MWASGSWGQGTFVPLGFPPGYIWRGGYRRVFPSSLHKSSQASSRRKSHSYHTEQQFKPYGWSYWALKARTQITPTCVLSISGVEVVSMHA